MAIGNGLAILGGSLASGAMGQQGANATTSAGKKALAEQQREFNIGQENLAPYKDVGTAALYKLAGALGIEGYRTNEERAYTEFLKTKPGAPGVDPNAYKNYLKPGFESSHMSGLEKYPEYGDAIGGVTKYIEGKKNKAKGKAAAAAAQQNATYQQQLTDWQSQADKLKAASDASLAGHNQNDATRAFLETDPSYNFRMAEGEKALTRANAGTVGTLGAPAIKSLLRYNQDYASNEFTNATNRLSAAAGLGQASSNASANLADTAGRSNASLLQAIGGSQASAYGSANNAIQGGISNYLTMNMYDKLLNAKAA